MPYILRNVDGSIKAARPNPVEPGVLDLEGWEYIDGSSKSYISFLESALMAENPFRESDIELARVLEDLISLLVDRGIIHFTDFPLAAQQRLIYRQSLRKRSKPLDIIDEDSENII